MINRFDVRDYTGLLQREKRFDKFIKGQSEKATAWLKDILEDYAEKSRKTNKGKVKPWQQTLLKLGGNILSPGAGSLISALTGAYNTAATDKAYGDLLADIGKKIEIPDWAKGTFMEDYLKTNVLSGQATAKNIISGSKKSSAMMGAGAALLDAISAGKGFAKSSELQDKSYNQVFNNKQVGSGFESSPITSTGYTSKVHPKVLGMIPGMGSAEALTNPLIDLAGKKGVGGRMDTGIYVDWPDLISELTTPSSWSQYAQEPLMKMLLGPKQETYVPELRPRKYRIRRS